MTHGEGVAPEATAAVVETSWTEAMITERCRVLRDTLRAHGVSAEDLAAMEVGGSANQTSDPLGAVIVWFALLRARFERVQEQGAHNAARAEAAVADALSNRPVSVTLSNGTTRAIYPKSWHALRYLDFLDAAARDVALLAAELESMDVTVQVPLIESLAVGLWCWILTHPEPGLPFNEHGEKTEPPAWTRQLSPDDLLAILQAHLEVNRLRISRIAELFPAEKQAASRLSLAGFLGTTAHEFGEQPSVILRGWTLGETFAMAVTAAQSARESRAAAETSAADRQAQRAR